MTLDEIKRLRASEYGVAALRPDHVDWLIAEVERLTAERDRYKAWHGAQVNKKADCRVYGHDNFGFARFKFDGQEPAVGTEYILRPKPLKENE